MPRLQSRILRVIAFLFISLILLSGCSLFDSSQNDSLVTETVTDSTSQKTLYEQQLEQQQKEAEIEKEEKAVSIVSCESDNASPDERGAITLVNSEGQREKLDDYCIERNEPAFQIFKVIYYCEGTEAKTKIYSCKNNMTCNKGSCI